MTAVIENSISLKKRTHEQVNYKRPVMGNCHRLGWFLACARRKATNQKEIMAAFEKGLNAWKLFEKKTAEYHSMKFLFSQFRNEEKSAQTTVGGLFSTRKTGYKKRRMGKSDHEPAKDGDDSDADHSIQIGGGRHA